MKVVNNETEVDFCSLPDEVIFFLLLHFLDSHALTTLSHSSYRMYKLVEASPLWHQWLLHDYGDRYENIVLHNSCSFVNSNSLVALPVTHLWHAFYFRCKRMVLNVHNNHLEYTRVQLKELSWHEQQQSTVSQMILHCAACSPDGKILVTCTTQGLIEAHEIFLNKEGCRFRQLDETFSRPLWCHQINLMSQFATLLTDTSPPSDQTSLEIWERAVSTQGSQSLTLFRKAAIALFNNRCIVASNTAGLEVLDIYTGSLFKNLSEDILHGSREERSKLFQATFSRCSIDVSGRNRQIVLVTPWCFYFWDLDTLEYRFRISTYTQLLGLSIINAADCSPPNPSENSAAFIQHVSTDITEKGRLSSLAVQVKRPLMADTEREYSTHALERLSVLFQRIQADFLWCGRKQDTTTCRNTSNGILPSNHIVAFARFLPWAPMGPAPLWVFDASTGAPTGVAIKHCAVHGKLRAVGQMPNSYTTDAYFLVTLTSYGRICLWSSFHNFQCFKIIDTGASTAFSAKLGFSTLIVLSDVDGDSDILFELEKAATVSGTCSLTTREKNSVVSRITETKQHQRCPLSTNMHFSPYRVVKLDCWKLHLDQLMYYELGNYTSVNDDCSTIEHRNNWVSPKLVPALCNLNNRSQDKPYRSLILAEAAFQITMLSRHLVEVTSAVRPIWSSTPCRVVNHSEPSSPELNTNPAQNTQMLLQEQPIQNMQQQQQQQGFDIPHESATTHTHFDTQLKTNWDVFDISTSTDFTQSYSQLKNNYDPLTADSDEQHRIVEQHLQCGCTSRTSSSIHRSHVACMLPGRSFKIALSKRCVTVQDYWI